ncbi:MAG: hypothetical protein WAS27_02685 [Candidatus Saccharimonadales bacterium]
MTVKKPKQIRTFSTNFFGVIGYISTTFVWLLVITGVILAFPLSVNETAQRVVMTPLERMSMVTPTTQSTQATAPVLVFFVSILFVIVFWAFSYMASRILSRVMRRLAHLASRRISGEVFFKTKYAVHAAGLVSLLLFVALAPVALSTKSSIALLGGLAGLLGMAAIAMQRQLAKRHHVPLDTIL